MGKPLTKKMKKRISDFYRSSDMSIGAIAENMGISRDSVRRHKNYDALDQPVQDQFKSMDHTSTNLEKHHWEPETIDSTDEYTNDYTETDESLDNYAEPRGNVIGALGKAILVIGGLVVAGLVILKFLAHRPSNNDENPSQLSWNNQGFQF